LRLNADERCCEVVSQGVDRGDDVAPELESIGIGISDRDAAGVSVGVRRDCEGKHEESGDESAAVRLGHMPSMIRDAEELAALTVGIAIKP
jgi:hypothetical protein